MGHDATKILLGTTLSTDKEISNFSSDPATFVAGLGVRVGSDGLLTLTKGSNSWAGVSMGASLSDTQKTSVLRCGLGVPVKLALTRARATVTITSYANLVSGTDDVITINGTAFTAQAGAATPGDATFQAATSNDATASSLASQINAHATIGLLVKAEAVAAVVTLSAITPGTGGNAITLTYTDNDTNVGATLGNATGGHLNDGAGTADFVVQGAQVFFDDATGLATEDLGAATVSNAIYMSGVLDGIDESGNTVPAAIVDMAGGL